jgi:hypothetical protein
MGYTGALYSVGAGLRGPGYADDYQLRGDNDGEGAALLGNKGKWEFFINLPRVRARLPRLNAQPRPPQHRGAA